MLLLGEWWLHLKRLSRELLIPIMQLRVGIPWQRQYILTCLTGIAIQAINVFYFSHSGICICIFFIMRCPFVYRIVNKINTSIGQDPRSKSIIGVLDIYGFESFKCNRYYFLSHILFHSRSSGKVNLVWKISKFNRKIRVRCEVSWYQVNVTYRYSFS